MDVKHFPPEVVKALAWPFDFDIRRASRDDFYFTISPPTELVPLAGDGAGGVYAQLKEAGDILFVDSEGSGGIIAPNLESLLVLFVSHPYWRELLKFSGGGSLAEMHRALPFAERDYYRSQQKTRELGYMIRKRLQLPDIPNSIELLHSSVTSSSQRLKLSAADGSQFGSLFNRFTVERNPAWRRPEN